MTVLITQRLEVLVIGRGQFAAHARWFFAATGFSIAALLWYGTEWAATGVPPRGSSRVGLTLGIAGAAIILFELLLWPRKRLLGARTQPFGQTKLWMKAHIWLGLLCIPFAVLHSGFRLGGWLPASVMIVFGIVIVSGVWGLYLQQAIPRRLLELVPEEVPALEIDRILASHTVEFERRLEMDRGELGGEAVPGIDVVREAYSKTVRDYLIGRARPATLRVTNQAERWFVALTAATPVAVHPRIRELKQLCDLHRQLDLQAQLHWWLHNWVWIHLPLSIALLGLLCAHVYTALRYL